MSKSRLKSSSLKDESADILSTESLQILVSLILDNVERSTHSCSPLNDKLNPIGTTTNWSDHEVNQLPKGKFK